MISHAGRCPVKGSHPITVQKTVAPSSPLNDHGNPLFVVGRSLAFESSGVRTRLREKTF